MRQIKFRGLRTDGKGWVYGSIVYPNRLLKGVWIVPDVNTCDFYPDQKDDEFDPNAEHHGITIGRFLEVIPESVGQFTGLHDKNGSEIYEGDQFAPDTDNDEVKSVVRWDETSTKFVVDSYGYDFHIGEGSQEVYDNELSICDTTDLGDVILEYCEIIGNTHTEDGGQEG